MPYYNRRNSYRRSYRGYRRYAPKRQTNKYIKNVSGSFNSAGSTTSEVITVFGGTNTNEAIATGTMSGLRWDIDIANTNTGPSRAYWAIVIVREGYNPNALNIGNNSNLYTPEQDVLAYGVATLTGSATESGPSIEMFSDTTRSMRKVQQGDRLMLLFASSTSSPAVNDTTVNATIQFFVKQ